MSSLDDRSCCILGGCGFLGSIVATRLVAAGWRVRVLDKEGVDDARLAPVRAQIELVRGDLMNAGDLSAGIEGQATVLHFAGTTIPQSSMADVKYDIGTNVLPLVQLLELVRARAGRLRLVYASSGGTVYGPAATRPITETHPTEPISAYGVSKLMAEKYIRLFAANYGVRYAILRIANPYGESQSWGRAQGAVSVFLHRVLSGEEIVVWGDGAHVRDFIYQADLADAVLAVIQRPDLQGIYNVGSGQGVGLVDLLRLIGSVVGRRPLVRYAPSRSFDVAYNVLDCARLRTASGWSAQTTLEQGIARMWQLSGGP